jgi:glucan 1,3-beta-glucosidase
MLHRRNLITLCSTMMVAWPFTLSLSLTLAPLLGMCSSTGNLGFALGNKRVDGSCKSTEDYENDMLAIKRNSGSEIVRLYSAAECDSAEQALPAARSQKFQILLGVWPDSVESFRKDKQAIASVAPRYVEEVYGVSVGSETLYRGVFDGDQLLQKIIEIKNVLPEGVHRIGTADTWDKVADGTADAVVGHREVNLILANAFAYWKPSSDPDESFRDQMRRVESHIERTERPEGASKIEIWTGETGWPSDGGSDNGLSKAGTSLAASYYRRTICGSVADGVNIFAFEAFDE